MPSRLRLLVALAAALALACNDGVSPGGGPKPGKGLGDTCDGADNKCRAGLACDEASSVCVGGMSLAEGAACSIGPECESGYCAPNGPKGQCAPAGAQGAGTTCRGDGQCAAGLKCAFDGQSLFPRCLTAGTKDTGAECTANRECAQGLFCEEGACKLVPVPAAAAPNGYPPIDPSPALTWQGVQCAAAKSTGITALFSLPRDGDDDIAKQDFFRLPFPNDAARDSTGTIDFSRFPRDPNPPFGFDALGRYLEVLKTEPFTNYGSVVFRFDGPVKFDSFNPGGTNLRVSIVNLTQGPAFGAGYGLFYQLSGGRNRYVCPNWFAVRPSVTALLPGTYAVILRRGVQAPDDTEVQSSPDFQAMLGASAPADPQLAAAWPAYAPLRQYLTLQNIMAADVLVASVFTVGDGQRLMKQLATAIAAEPVPVADPWVRCGSGTASPCPDSAGVRACGSSSAFDEWHTLVDVPIFQEGTTPYLTPADRGDIRANAGVVRREKICAALTTPKGTPPPGGWPLVLYAHGTGGTFRSHAGDGAGNALANVDIDGGTADGGAISTGYAVLGFDQVGHGPRRGARTDVSPDDIVFNFGNPASARGTMAQGSADLLGMARFAKALGGAADAGLPPIDSSRLVFWGHSQGATEGAMFLAFDRTTDGALLTGASASLTDALLTKKAPVNIADSMWLALGEAAPGSVDTFHPVLSLLQGWTDPVDPVNFARDVVTVPAAGALPIHRRHVLMLWGKDDTFTATAVQGTFAVGAGLTLVGPEADMSDFVDPAPMPVQGNVGGKTAAVMQYAPAGYDGHFVVYQDPGAQHQAAHFIARVAAGLTPRVPAP